MQSLPVLFLKRNADRRVRSGHPWIYGNEIDAERTPPGGLEPGTLVEVRAADRQAVLGIGYVNPVSLITVRLLDIAPGQAVGDWLAARLATALALREKLSPEPCYRLVHGEADGLPGLVVDRFGDHLAVQVNTAGMEALTAPLLDTLETLLHPRGILLRNDASVREREGLVREVVVGRGEVPDEVEISEDGTRFLVPLRTGQKTGWFYDQRWNRRVLPHFAPGARVLDLFCYLGGWGVRAATCGAREVVCVDASAPALEIVERNAALNGVADRVRTVRGDAFEVLKQFHRDGETFDVLVVDPPAFIKRRKDLDAGREAYRRVNHLAARLAADEAVLVSCSCSSHLPEPELEEICHQAARQAGHRCRFLFRGGQGPDHPVHPAMPETRYLKALTAALSRG
ncbi:class I SAM-dependent rRNA methyltransferase [bacterium]|nr:class I SAM-dependent rRNA methyltransferase [bacterium]